MTLKPGESAGVMFPINDLPEWAQKMVLAGGKLGTRQMAQVPFGLRSWRSTVALRIDDTPVGMMRIVWKEPWRSVPGRLLGRARYELRWKLWWFKANMAMQRIGRYADVESQRAVARRWMEREPDYYGIYPHRIRNEEKEFSQCLSGPEGPRVERP